MSTAHIIKRCTNVLFTYFTSVEAVRESHFLFSARRYLDAAYGVVDADRDFICARL